MIVIKPTRWTVVKNPTVVYQVYIHPSCDQVRLQTPYRFRDCLGAALSNYGRVCGVAFQLVPEATPWTHFRFWSMPWDKLGAAGNAGYGDGWIAICQTMFDGKTRYGTWSTMRLIGILQHEIGHKPQFSSLGWPLTGTAPGIGGFGHAPPGTLACMEPNTPAIARYPGTEEGVDKLGLAGFSRREANYLAVRYGIRWLHYVEQESN